MDAPTALPPAASALGVSFDGRAWHYRQFSYDHLEDALNFARLDLSRPGVREQPAPVHWRHWTGPTAEDEMRMTAHGIAYEQGYYRYGPYRYEQLDAAVAYAQREPGLSRGGQATARDQER
jgi:hypothetical protein